MSNDKGYKDTKEFICTGCGKTIVLTKFASQKTCKCDECKANNVPTNPDIVAEALKTNPPKERKKSSGGDTKTLPCVECGEMVEVSKFMSAQKVLCDKCKGTSASSHVASSNARLHVDKSKLKNVKIPPLEEYEMNGGMIANKRLREVVCPACGHEHMKPLMIADWSQFGLIVHYQCPECLLLMNISEQCKHRMKIYRPSQQFDYTGRQVREIIIGHSEHTRMGNILNTLIKVCEEHDINIDEIFDKFGDTVPPYRFENEKPVPRGFVVPPEDKWISTVHQAKEFLNANMGDDTTATQIADKLNDLLKGGNEDVSIT
jgi:DNA-directed RNA polymerase subunit M/transcription elongation factor TFIIS